VTFGSRIARATVPLFLLGVGFVVNLALAIARRGRSSSGTTRLELFAFSASAGPHVMRRVPADQVPRVPR
jgi:hypothetical protein